MSRPSETHRHNSLAACARCASALPSVSRSVAGGSVVKHVAGNQRQLVDRHDCQCAPSRGASRCGCVKGEAASISHTIPSEPFSPGGTVLSAKPFALSVGSEPPTFAVPGFSSSALVSVEPTLTPAQLFARTHHITGDDEDADPSMGYTVTVLQDQSPPFTATPCCCCVTKLAEAGNPQGQGDHPGMRASFARMGRPFAAGGTKYHFSVDFEVEYRAAILSSKNRNCTLSWEERDKHTSRRGVWSEWEKKLGSHRRVITTEQWFQRVHSAHDENCRKPLPFKVAGQLMDAPGTDDAMPVGWADTLEVVATIKSGDGCDCEADELVQEFTVSFVSAAGGTVQPAPGRRGFITPGLNGDSAPPPSPPGK